MRKAGFAFFVFIFLFPSLNWGVQYARSMISLDAGPLVMGVSRWGWGLGAGYECVVHDQFSVELNVAYEKLAYNTIDDLNVYLTAKYYLANPAPSGAYMGLGIMDDHKWSGGVYVNSPGIGAILGYRYLISEYNGFFVEASYAFYVVLPIVSQLTPTTWFPIGLKAGWAF